MPALAAGVSSIGVITLTNPDSMVTSIPKPPNSPLVSVSDSSKVIKEVSNKYSDSDQDNLDGLTVRFDKCWFNLRPSNTEPLLRLNLEAEDEVTYEKTLQEVQELIESNKEL